MNAEEEFDVESLELLALVEEAEELEEFGGEDAIWSRE